MSENGVKSDDDDEAAASVVARPNLSWEDQDLQGQTMETLYQMKKEKQFCDVTLQASARGNIIRQAEDVVIIAQVSVRRRQRRLCNREC